MQQVLSTVIGVLIGLVVLWLVLPSVVRFGIWLRARLQLLESKLRARLPEWRKLLLPPPAPSPPASDVPAAPRAAAGTGEEPLSARLHRLEAVFGASTANAAHPRELGEHGTFCEAVDLLTRPERASRHCRAIRAGRQLGAGVRGLRRARQERADGGQAPSEAVAHFDKLYPWPMHFALEYFLGVETRPPVGAPLVGAKDWWAENVIIPMLFRDYFARARALGDAPLFGSAVPSAASARRRQGAARARQSSVRDGAYQSPADACSGRASTARF